MLCRIADLLVDVPPAGGMAARCGGYAVCGGKADMVIDESRYSAERWPGLEPSLVPYMESGLHFYVKLLRFDGLMLHASAVAYGGKAYLFSGPSGMGKSTHAGLWQKLYGAAVTVLNDDKPALRLIDGTWQVYGTPWCGKDGINRNRRAPLGGICFLERGKLSIERLTPQQGLRRLLPMTTYQLYPGDMKRLLPLLGRLAQEVPLFLLRSGAEDGAAILAKETMTDETEG